MGRRFMILKKKKGLPSPRGNMHVYYHNIQRSSLKPFDQSKPNVIGAFLGRENGSLYINDQGHMTKMAIMAINSKSL